MLGAIVCASAMMGCAGDDDGDPMNDAGTGGSDSGMQSMTDAGGDTEDSGTAPVDAGRADSGGGGSDAGVDGGGGDDGPTFAELRAELSSCTSCHSGGGRAGLTLSGSDEDVYAELVDEERTHDSCNEHDVRVVPNDPESSVLYLRTHGTDCGSTMPANATQRQLIEDWINAGAPGPT
ncbi:hypothetical protein DB32_005115 [Sandaracinus amylolyticus]|uniref:Cytochrome c domain-containing protein n=1 Tax=Sandaracinus amylolyticus TaxID=927083 RepID=A0A0F6YK56_9BACT|nr:hypothetical protein DB32_005115 [Sandaracinus amylolyticus]